MAALTLARAWAPPRPRLVILVYLFLVATNLFDAFATLRVLEIGVEEWNPIMRVMLGAGPIHFVAFKTAGIAVLGGLIAVGARRFRWAWMALCGLSAAYTLLLAAHVAFILYAPVKL
jgi:hypothetical protein